VTERKDTKRKENMEAREETAQGNRMSTKGSTARDLSPKDK